MKIFNRTLFAGLLASGAFALSSCGGGYSGPPSVLNPGATATPSGGTTATPSGGTTATPSGGTTATPSGGTTATPSGGTTATPSGNATPTPVSTGSTSMPSTSMPATSMPATSMPSTSMPSTSMPATSMPATSMPATSMPAMSCPPNPIPSPLSTTVPFPNGAGGTITNPPYYDSSGTTMFPANNAAAGTNLTIKIGGSNYDGFAADSKGGTTLVYIESSVSGAQNITFTGSNPAITIVSTSPSCFTTGHTYSMDVDVKGLASPIATAVVTQNGDTLTFSISNAQNQFPANATLQLTINRES